MSSQIIAKLDWHILIAWKNELPISFLQISLAIIGVIVFADRNGPWVLYIL